MRHQHTPDAHPDPGLGPGYETRDANVAGLLTFGVGLIVFCVVIQLALLAFYYLFERERPGEVRLSAQDNLYTQLRTLRKNEATALENYGWVDRKTGIVRIPI